MAEHHYSGCSKNIPTHTIRQQDRLINLEPGLKFNDFEGSHSRPVNRRHINFINKILWSPYLTYASVGTVATEPIFVLSTNTFDFWCRQYFPSTDEFVSSTAGELSDCHRSGLKRLSL